MSRPILSEYGPDAAKSQKPAATSGGVTECKELAYDPPKGPTGMMRQGPGLGGTNHGNCGTQGRR